MNNNNKSSLVEELTKEDDKEWLTTYADMMTLLLAFFVLLYAIHAIKNEEFKRSLSNIKISLETDGTTVSMIEFLEASNSSQPLTFEEASGLQLQEDRIRAELTSILDNTATNNAGIKARRKANKIILMIPGEFLFESGSAILNDQALPLFDEVKKVFDKYPEYAINIRGHTDDRPINTAQFPSNWELSAVRATTVLRYFLQQNLSTERISATGYADLLPIASNNTAQGRSENRRVEFVLEKAAR